MSLITITGKPGMGKTLLLTYLASCEFRRFNNPIKIFFIEKILRKEYVYILNQYSDFPICFKKKKKNKVYKYYDENKNIQVADSLYSLKFRIFDLVLPNKFVDDASFYIDEIQAKYDSMEYKSFPDSIAHYCQAHRHFNNNIYCTSQSQSRIIKRLLVLSEEYWNVDNFRKIFGFGIVHLRVTYDMSANLEESIVNENLIYVDYFRKIFRLSRVGSMYDSKYLRFLQLGSKKYKSEMYSGLELSPTEIMHNFFPSEEEKKMLNSIKY